MKVNNIKKRTQSGFTLIEMIGVLAVIAILAAVLIPKIFEAINNSRVNNAAMSCQTVKTAIADHYAKFGSLAVDGRATPPTLLTAANAAYDEILLGESFLDKPFAVKIGDGNTANTTIRMDLAEAATATPIAATPVAVAAGMAAYCLDGDTTVANKATGSHVVHAIISGVNLSDARELNARIDGSDAALGETVTTAGSESDINGRVKYTMASGSATVYVYLTHR